MNHQDLKELLNQIKEKDEIINGISDSLMLLDARTMEILEVNRAFLENYNLSREQVIGKTCHQITHHLVFPCSENESVACPLATTSSTGVISTAEHMHFDCNGRPLHFEVTTLPLLNEKGEAHRVIHLSRNITARKKADEEIQKERDRAQEYLDIAGVTLVGLAPDQTITLINKKGCELLGYAQDELIGRNWFDMFIPERERDKVKTTFARLINGELEPLDFAENSVVTRGGQERLLIWHNALVRDSAGDIVGTLSSGEDITERKRAEETLRKSYEKTKLFAYSVSHDLKSPAVAIYGLTKRLHQVYADILDEKGRACCDQILKAAEHISALVAQINVYISTSTAPLVIEAVKLKDILQMVREEFAPQLGVRQIKWSEPKHLPELNADRIAMLRVFRNLVDNALKYGGDHLTEIRLDYRDGEGLHILSVSNDGDTLGQEDFEDLFGPFQRAETAKGVAGAGLGLAIVKELVEQHGGEVRVELTQEKWTTFNVSISKNL